MTPDERAQKAYDVCQQTQKLNRTLRCMGVSVSEPTIEDFRAEILAIQSERERAIAEAAVMRAVLEGGYLQGANGHVVDRIQRDAALSSTAGQALLDRVKLLEDVAEAAREGCRCGYGGHLDSCEMAEVFDRLDALEGKDGAG